MTWEEYRDLIAGKINQLKMVDQYTRTAVNNVWRESQMRIFTEGQKSDGSPMGTYTEKYREYKAKKYGTGSKVDLVATSQFRAAYSWGKRGDEYVIGFIDAQRKNASGASSQVNNTELRKVNEERYGVVFDMTGREYQNALKAIAFRINEIIDG